MVPSAAILGLGLIASATANMYDLIADHKRFDPAVCPHGEPDYTGALRRSRTCVCLCVVVWLCVCVLRRNDRQTASFVNHRTHAHTRATALAQAAASGPTLTQRREPGGATSPTQQRSAPRVPSSPVRRGCRNPPPSLTQRERVETGRSVSVPPPPTRQPPPPPPPPMRPMCASGTALTR